MNHAVAESQSTWAEDTALLRSNRSADPGAKTGAGIELSRSVPLPLRDWHQSAKPSRHDAAKSSTRRPSQLANVNRRKFQFPLNQDTAMPQSLSFGAVHVGAVAEESITLVSRRNETCLIEVPEVESYDYRLTVAALGDGPAPRQTFRIQMYPNALGMRIIKLNFMIRSAPEESPATLSVPVRFLGIPPVRTGEN